MAGTRGVMEAVGVVVTTDPVTTSLQNLPMAWVRLLVVRKFLPSVKFRRQKDKYESLKSPDKLPVPRFPKDGGMTIWLGELSVQILGAVGYTDMKDKAWIYEAFTKTFDELAIKANPEPRWRS